MCVASSESWHVELIVFWGNIALLKDMSQRAVLMRTDWLWIRSNSLDILGDTVIAGLQRYSEK